ncbi:hypothetical protein bcgnr5390_58470 [Bacillus luti]
MNLTRIAIKAITKEKNNNKNREINKSKHRFIHYHSPNPLFAFNLFFLESFTYKSILITYIKKVRIKLF